MEEGEHEDYDDVVIFIVLERCVPARKWNNVGLTQYALGQTVALWVCSEAEQRAVALTTAADEGELLTWEWGLLC